MALYSVPSAKAWISRMLSDLFKITNVTRQGCLLSPLIFVLVIEPLEESIHTCKMIEGIHVGREEHKLGLYTDDTLIALTKPLSLLPALQNILNTFITILLYKVNLNHLCSPCNYL